MNLSKEQLEQVELLAYRMFSPANIAVAIEVDVIDFIDEVRTRGTEAHQAFFRGYMQQQAELRESIIKAAKNGSNPAQMELLKLLKKTNQAINYE